MPPIRECLLLSLGASCIIGCANRSMLAGDWTSRSPDDSTAVRITQDGSFDLWTWEVVKYIGDARQLRHKGDRISRGNACAEVLWTEFTPTTSAVLIGIQGFHGDLATLYAMQAALSQDGSLSFVCHELIAAQQFERKTTRATLHRDK